MCGSQRRLRSIGLGLIDATQEVSSVDPIILSNTSNWIVTHLNNKAEVRELSKYYDFEDFSELTLKAEDVGFARIKTRSGRYMIPTQIDLLARNVCGRLGRPSNVPRPTLRREEERTCRTTRIGDAWNVRGVSGMSRSFRARSCKSVSVPIGSSLRREAASRMAHCCLTPTLSGLHQPTSDG